MVERRGETAVFDKEMGITHRDFLRLLPGALDGLPHRVEGRRITADAGGGRRIEITFSEETRRRIAGLTMPVTHVRLTFSGFSEDTTAATLARFERAYHRGGG